MGTSGKGEVKNAALHLEWELNDEYMATSITAYQNYVDNFGGDSDGSAINMGEFTNQRTISDNFSQEFRLEFSGESWEYLAGLYFAHNSLDTLSDIHVTVIRDLTEPVEIFDLPTVVDLSIHNLDKETDSFGAFFHNTFNVTDETTAVSLPTFPEGLWPPEDTTSFKAEESFSAWSGTFKLSHYLNEDILLYGSLDRGYKHGGFNEAANRLNQGVAPEDQIDDTFDKEISDNRELGFKSTLWNSRFRLNGTVFHQNFDDYQVVVPEGSQGTAIVRAADVTTQGVEMEFAIAVSTEFLVGGALTYTDAKYDDFEGAPCTPGQRDAAGVGAACTQDLSGET